MKFGAYYYPLTTNDETRKARAVEYGLKNVADETLLPQLAQPLFDGHRQPKTFCLGDSSITRWDDSNVAIMERQIGLARSHGIDYFVFDTYIGVQNGKPYKELLKPLDNAFLAASNLSSIEFAVSCVFGGSRALLPLPLEKNEEINRFCDMSVLTARTIVDHCATKYWHLPNYLRVDGKPYISFNMSDIRPGVGQSLQQALELVIHEVVEYSYKQYGYELYTVGVIKNSLSKSKDMASSGVNALTGYALLPDFSGSRQSIQDYATLLNKRIIDWHTLKDMYPHLPFLPTAVVGWDSSPRGEGGHTLADVEKLYPFTPIVMGGSPELFGQMISEAHGFIQKNVPLSQQLMLICAWNEVTEGMALLPEVIDGKVNNDYLEALSRAKNYLNPKLAIVTD